MDTFSSTVSTLKVPALPQTNREFYQFKRTPYATPNRPTQPQPSVSSTSIPNNLVPKKNNPISHKCYSPSLPFSSSKTTSSSPLQPSSPIFHAKPATGYAAAIIDVAQSSNSLHLVHRDIQRLLRFLQSDLVEELKGQAMIMKQVVEQGNFHRHVVALLKMLLKKSKVGIVQEVLEEFERIYDELCGTQVVLVSSEARMGEDELFGIAKWVQQLSGAVRVRVKVRNMVQQNNSPSFALWSEYHRSRKIWVGIVQSRCQTQDKSYKCIFKIQSKLQWCKLFIYLISCNGLDMINQMRSWLCLIKQSFGCNFEKPK